MIQEYVLKLIENLPNEMKNNERPLKIDLVLDGGIFNGSYLIGALYFLKEMEKRKYIIIERISGCSVGSIAGFLYFIDALDMMSSLYQIVNENFKQNYSLNVIKDMKNQFGDKIPQDVCEKIKNRFFITYHNIKKGTKPVKCSYKNVDEIINTIISSCYIPYLVDGNILYNEKYIDGIIPYIFNKEFGKKILYLDLFGYDKIGNLLNVKNEKTNFHRVLSGLLDIHSFYIKQSNTQMCSYVNEWSYLNLSFYYFKLFIEKVFILFIHVFIYIKNKVPDEYKETMLFKIVTKITQDVFIIFIDSYCF
jgi:hypothetical protein